MTKELGKKQERDTAQIFDLILKQLIRLSSAAVIQFINGLFGTNHPLDSTVDYPNTETVSKKLRRLQSDTIIIIGGVYAYHIEAEIGDDENIVVRVFEYGLAEALRTKTLSEDGSKISIKFPSARIIYWETTKKTPDEVTLSLEFSEGEQYNYKVKSFKFLEHDIKELEERKLAILLPFYVLKLRKQTVSAKTSKRRAELAVEMKEIVDELVMMADRAEASGLVSEADKRIVLEHMERLYRELFAQYAEFKEGDVMLQDRILTYSEEAAKKAAKEAELKGIERGIEKGIEKGIERGIEKGRAEKAFDMARKMLARGMTLLEVAEIAELPIDKLQTLVPHS
ncbi:hypothetical protein FACS1894187_16410 [Synergistales bacterium]|nr:hypothetical protein FACS1894187_16410 [Synergistales bacterium]